MWVVVCFGLVLLKVFCFIFGPSKNAKKPFGDLFLLVSRLLEGKSYIVGRVGNRALPNSAPK